MQGGTFLNDAVLRALEQHIGREVTRAPYPGLMGAIGIALLTQEHLEGARREGSEVASSLKNANATSEGREPVRATAFSLDALDAFSYTQESNLICPFCANHCNRTRITFANGDSWVTGNRCPRGEVVGDPKDKSIRDQVKRIAAAVDSVPNLFDVREKLLFRDWPCTPDPAPQNHGHRHAPRPLDVGIRSLLDDAVPLARLHGETVAPEHARHVRARALGRVLRHRVLPR